MKKIIFLIAFFFGLSTVSFAQEKKVEDAYVLAKKEINALVKVINNLDPSIESALYNLLVYKHETLAKATSEKEKNDVYATMKGKIDGTLTPEQLRKLKSNKVLYEDLIK